MIKVKRIAAQGDALFRKIDKLPDNVVEQKAENGLYILAHSETQHHHAVDACQGIRIFQEPNDPLVGYLVMEGVEHADVVHHRGFDTHEMLRLLATPNADCTVFEVRRQREYSPEGWRRVQD